MGSLIGGALAGMAQGASYLAKKQIDQDSAVDLAQINSNIAIEREARIRENTRATNERDVAAIESNVPQDTQNRTQALIDEGVRRGNYPAADQLRKKQEAEDKRLARQDYLAEKRQGRLDRKETQDRYHRSEEDRARERDVQAASQVYGRLLKARTDGEPSLKDATDDDLKDMATEQVRLWRRTDFTKENTGPTPAETARAEKKRSADARGQATSEVNDAASAWLPDFLDPNIKGSRKGMIERRAAEIESGGGFGPGKSAAKPTSQQGRTPPREAFSGLQEGMQRRFKNGQVWTIQNGQPVKVQ